MTETVKEILNNRLPTYRQREQEREEQTAVVDKSIQNASQRNEEGQEKQLIVAQQTNEEASATTEAVHDVKNSIDTTNETVGYVSDQIADVNLGVYGVELNTDLILDENREQTALLESINGNTKKALGVSIGNTILQSQAVELQRGTFKGICRIEDGINVTNEHLEDMVTGVDRIGDGVGKTNKHLKKIKQVLEWQHEALEHIGITIQKGTETLEKRLYEIKQGLIEQYLQQERHHICEIQTLEKINKTLNYNARNIQLHKAEERYLDAHQHFNAQNYRGASQDIKKALKEKSTHLPSLIMRGKIEAHRHSWKNAAETFAYASKLANQEKNSEAYQAAILGVVHTKIMDGDFEDAIKSLGEGIEKYTGEEYLLKLQKEKFYLGVIDAKRKGTIKERTGEIEDKFREIYKADNSFWEEVLENKITKEIVKDIPRLRYGPFTTLAEIISRLKRSSLYSVVDDEEPLIHWTTEKIDRFAWALHDLSLGLEYLCDKEKGKVLRQDPKVMASVKNQTMILNYFNNIYYLYSEENKSDIITFAKTIENYVPTFAIEITLVELTKNNKIGNCTFDCEDRKRVKKIIEKFPADFIEKYKEAFQSHWLTLRYKEIDRNNLSGQWSDLSKRYYKTLAAYEQTERLDPIAAFAEEAGNIERALELYTQSEQYQKAAVLAKESGLEKKIYTSLFAKAAEKALTEKAHLGIVINLFEEAEQYEKAADLLVTTIDFDAVNVGNKKCEEYLDKLDYFIENSVIVDEVTELYLQANQLDKAAETLHKFGQDAEAIAIYTKRKMYKRGAAFAEKIGKIDQAIDIYTTAKLFKEAAIVAERNNRLEDAINLYYKAENHKEAATIAEKIGKIDQAIDIYTTAKLFKEAAIVAERNNRLEDAISLYLQAGKHTKAAMIAEEKGDLERSVTILFNATLYNQAESIALKNNRCDLMLKKYRELNKYQEAALFAEKNGLYEEAICCYENENQWDEAIRVSVERGIRSNGHQSYQKAISYYHAERQSREAAKFAWKYGQIEDAMRDYERMALRINLSPPGFWEAIATIKCSYGFLDRIFGTNARKKYKYSFRQKYGTDFLKNYEEPKEEEFCDPEPCFWKAIVAAKIGGNTNKASQLFNLLMNYNWISERKTGNDQRELGYGSFDYAEDSMVYHEIFERTSAELGPLGNKIF